MPSRRLKVLFAINCLNIGGAPSVVVSQLQTLDRTRFDPYLLTLYPSKAANFFAEVDAFLPEDHQRHFRLKNRSIFDLKTLWQIYSFLRQERFDLVYTHLFLTNFLIRILAILARVPVIVVFEHSTYFNKSWWQVWADRFLNLFSNAVIVSTDKVAEFTLQQQKLPRKKVKVIPNPVFVPPVDQEYLHRVKNSLSLRPEEKIFVTIGRFSVEKGQSVLLEAVSLINKPARFLIVGHGPEENLIRSRIVDLKISEKVIVIKEPEKAKQFLFLADAFILPSWREGQGLVVYEALTAGVPVIGSDLPTVKEVIIPNKNGLLFPVGSAPDLATAINLFLEDQELSARLKIGAVNTTIDYSKEKAGQQIGELFLSLIKN